MSPLSTQRDNDVDIGAIRRELSRSKGRAYWRSLEELAQTPDFTAFLESEFPRLAPLWDAPIDRRNALKLMAASMALAGLTACGRQPPESIVSPVTMPENRVAGQSRYYASALTLGGYAEGVLVESREGRPIKVEGNPDHPASLGATDAISQARILDLYDPDRSQTVMRGSAISSYGRFLGALQQTQSRLDAGGGEGLCILTGALSSPSQLAAIDSIRQRYPGARWFTHEPVSRNNSYRGAELAYGRPLETRYRFDRADVVVSLDADFLGSLPGRLRYAREFTARRRPGDGDTAFNRLYTAEATPTLTGAAADHRLALPAGAIEPLAHALARQLAIVEGTATLEDRPARWAVQAARELQRSRGRGIVIAGDQQPSAVHALVHAINTQLDNTGRTAIHSQPVLSASAETLDDLARAMEGDRVDTLLILGANPVYTAPPALQFAERLQRVPLAVHWGEYRDETARACDWHLPAAHTLESWDDTRAYDGSVSLIQPLIEPLHGGLTALQVLADFAGDFHRSALELLKAHWQRRWENGEAEARWRQSLQRGVVADTALPAERPRLRNDWRRRLPRAQSGDGLELELRPDPTVWDGRFANNGWLQELPKPLTRLTWDNAALISPALAEQLGLSNGQLVQLSAGQRSLRAPVCIQPGQADDSVTLHLGYGREHAGRIGSGIGANAYRLLTTEETTFSSGWSVVPERQRQTLASTQHHHAMHGHDLLRTATLEEYRHNPAFATEGKPHPAESLYPERRYEDHAWGMTIDLGSCIGCNACITACQAENNIPIVGREEVARGREMQWLRVDRYFGGPVDAPSIHFQPVPCMHCEKAPCEYVCPVEATLHNSEGLNEMVYNRCVGTRYCSQNCPYKVRRFNWFHYSDPRNALATPAPTHNPDVTVRSRGVMEKCTYCVQRINRARIQARNESRPLRDGDIRTACQQVCPTEAIVFGDINDPGSRVSQLKRDSRNYSMLAELNTRPRTTYLAAVHNPDSAFEATSDGDAGEESS